MSIVWLLLMGLIVGAIARLVVPGRLRIGILGTMAVGIGGAFLGWWLGRQILGPGNVFQHRWIWATIGSILLVVVVTAIANRGLSSRRLGRRW